MSDRAGSRPARRGLRSFRLPRAAGVVLAVPAFLAVGSATLAALIVGVSALLLAPGLRRRRGRWRDRRTITLDPSAYRALDDAGALVDGRAPAGDRVRP